MEQSQARQMLYSQMMAVQHRNITPMVQAFRAAMSEDPDFVARAMVYTVLNSRIRDQQDAAIVTLLQADPVFPEYREAGRCLLLGNDVYEIEYAEPVTGLPPYRIFRVEWYIRSPYVVMLDGKNPVARFPGEAYARKRLQRIANRLGVSKDRLSVSLDTSHVKPSRLFRNMMRDYLYALEANPERFDGVALNNRKALLSVYKYWHIKMGKRAKAILIDKDYPPDSKLGALREIANSDDPKKKLELVRKHRIGYRVLQSVLSTSTEDRIVLVEAMSPTEARNARAWMERNGLLEIPEVREVYLNKVRRATGDIASIDHRKSVQGTNEEVNAALAEAQEKAIASVERVEGVVDIWLDTSGSMTEVIEHAPAFAERLFPICDDKQLVIFNSAARVVEVKDTGNPFHDVRNALRGVRAGGGTQFVKAFLASTANGRTPQRIIMLTDGGDNRGGVGLLQELKQYSERTGIYPQFVMIEFSGPYTDSDVVTPALRKAGYEVEKFSFQGDYYAFDQAISVLGGPPAMTLADKIMATELPHRKGWTC